MSNGSVEEELGKGESTPDDSGGAGTGQIDEDEAAMQSMMGFGGFGSTKVTPDIMLRSR